MEDSPKCDYITPKCLNKKRKSSPKLYYTSKFQNSTKNCFFHKTPYLAWNDLQGWCVLKQKPNSVINSNHLWREEKKLLYSRKSTGDRNCSLIYQLDNLDVQCWEQQVIRQFHIRPSWGKRKLASILLSEANYIVLKSLHAQLMQFINWLLYTSSLIYWCTLSIICSLPLRGYYVPFSNLPHQILLHLPTLRLETSPPPGIIGNYLTLKNKLIQLKNNYVTCEFSCAMLFPSYIFSHSWITLYEG